MQHYKHIIHLKIIAASLNVYDFKIMNGMENNVNFVDTQQAKLSTYNILKTFYSAYCGKTFR